MWVMCLLALTASAVASPAIAQEIYKTVDEEGKVSYTSAPPPEGAAETLQTLPEPDKADVDAALQRQQKIEEQLDKQAEARREAAEREAYYDATRPSTIVVNNPPAIVPGYYYPRPRHDHWRNRDRWDRDRDRDRDRPTTLPARKD